MLPTQRQVELPLLTVIDEAGGQIKSSDAYDRLLKYFPQIIESDLKERLPSGPNKWQNTVQWARQRLIDNEELIGVSHGIWKITSKGRERLGKLGTPITAISTVSKTTTQATRESDLYEPVKQALEKLLAASTDIHVEITANGISKVSQRRLDDAAFLFLKSEKTQPDIMGYLLEEVSPFGLELAKRGHRATVIAEIKNDEIRIPDIYQAKRYAEVFDADYAFLISSEDVSEDVKRFVRNRPNVLKYQHTDGPREIIYGHYESKSKQIGIESFED
jgi:hypothetical protein